MVNLRIENFSADKPTKLDDGSWYTFADFHVSSPKSGARKLLGRRTIYGHRIILVIGSQNLDKKPIDPYITDNLFVKRLNLDKFNEADTKKYIQTKIDEANKAASISEAFNYLERFFEVDD